LELISAQIIYPHIYIQAINTARLLQVVFVLDCCCRLTPFDFCVDKCGDGNNREVKSWMGVQQRLLPVTLFSSIKENSIV